MKKFTMLLLGIGAFVGAGAQNLISSGPKAVRVYPKTFDDKSNASAPATLITKAKKTRDPFQSTLGTKENVGKTTYDLQTNGSMARRVLQGTGGKVSCGWTFSSEQGVTSASTYPDRGTGYSYFDGTAWTAAPTARIESATRTGFGGIVVDGTGSEVYVAHDADADKLSISKKSGSTWTTNVLTTSNVNKPIWPHTAAAGNWMYVIATPVDSNTHSNGIRSGYFFARSNDNGATWIDNMIPMPGIDSIGHYSGGADSYAITARDSNVAILFGDYGTDVTLMRSHDYGATWTNKKIIDFPLNHWNPYGTAPSDDLSNGVGIDTIDCMDGSSSIVLDANGQVHVAFPMVSVYNDGTGLFVVFGDTRLVYYNSIVDDTMIIDQINLKIHDCDQNNALDFGINYAGNTTSKKASYNTAGMLTQPSISIVPGSPQKVLIAYTALMDGDTTEDDGIHTYWYGSSAITGQPYRDILVIGSPDNGASWKYPVNISRSKHFEEAFISTPEIITGTKFPVLCQADIEPGTIMQKGDDFDPSFQNFMILQQVDITDIFTLGSDSTKICDQSELPLGVKNILSGDEAVMNVYPNPSSDFVNVALKFINTAKSVTIDMVDITGNVVYTAQLQNVNEEYTKIPVASLANGMYVIKVSTETGITTRKFMKD